MRPPQFWRSAGNVGLRRYFFHAASYPKDFAQRLIILCSSVFLLFLSSGSFSLDAAAAQTAGETDSILSVAESTFEAMKFGNYKELWSMLSRETQDTIVEDVLKAVKKDGVQIEKKEVIQDFAGGGSLSKAYWDGYLTAFNPDIFLEQSRWALGEIGKEKAEILIQYRKAERPARLKLFKENGLWRVGLKETFAGRSLLEYFTF